MTLPGSLRISGNPSQCRAHTESRQPIIYVTRKIFSALSMCENFVSTDEGSPTLPDIFCLAGKGMARQMALLGVSEVHDLRHEEMGWHHTGMALDDSDVLATGWKHEEGPKRHKGP